MFCCFLCDAQRQVVGIRFINGMCSTCAGSVSDVRLQRVFRCCFVPLCWVQWSRIICSRCGVQHKSRLHRPHLRR